MNAPGMKDLLFTILFEIVQLPCDKEVHDALLNSLHKTMPSKNDASSLFGNRSIQAIGNITNASADSFYSSQGRITSLFRDENDQLVSNIRKAHPEAQTFEMETFLLNHLAKSANESSSTKEGKGGVMRTGAAQMV